jgi:hypothetical protein
VYSFRLLIREARSGGLSGHLGEKKTYELLKEHFFWPSMLKNVHKVKNAYGLYMTYFQSSHGWILVWTLYMSCLEHSVERIRLRLWLIDYLKRIFYSLPEDRRCCKHCQFVL